MFAGIFSCTPSFSPEINKVYLILSYYLIRSVLILLNAIVKVEDVAIVIPKC